MLLVADITAPLCIATPIQDRNAAPGHHLNDAHAQRVEALFEQAQRVAPLAGDLPALVGRLQALQGLHAESLAFRWERGGRRR